MNAFAKFKGLERTKHKFMFDGQVVQSTDTAEALDLEDEDLIECEEVKAKKK